MRSAKEKEKQRCDKKQNSGKKSEKIKNKNKISHSGTMGGILFAKMAKGGAAELRCNQDEVNKLNVFPVPDGDTGDNMRMTIESGIAEIENLNSDNLAEVMRALSHGMLLGARGNSGVILSQFFAGMALALKDSSEANAVTLGQALKEGVKQAYSTVMTPTEGTILTVAREAVEYAVSKTARDTTIKEFFSNLVDEIYASLARTPEILPALKSAGVVDSGGAGLFYIMDGFKRVLNGEIPEEKTRGIQSSNTSQSTKKSFSKDSKMTFSYCTELLVQLLESKCDIESFDIDEFNECLSKLGDSVCTVHSDSTLKLHIHTFKPENVIAYSREFGELISVKIENMSIQHSAMSDSETSENVGNTDNLRKQIFTKCDTDENNPKKKYGIITTSWGDGLTRIFSELGADKVITGKSGFTPSARDFIEAIESLNADHIFIFPNNSNITLAATQAVKIHGDPNVHVIETKNIGEGYAAIASFESENSDSESVTKNLYSAISNVSCGYTSVASRNAELDGVKIKKGDTVGIINKKIVISKSSSVNCAKEIALTLLCGKSNLTVFFGKDVTKKDAEKLRNTIKKKREDTDIYVLFGGQDIYSYIFVAG